jgi:hypothetical protein
VDGEYSLELGERLGTKEKIYVRVRPRCAHTAEFFGPATKEPDVQTSAPERLDHLTDE